MNDVRRSGLQYTDRVALITGGSMGIGKGCARVFCDAGAKVMICARKRPPGEALAEELTAAGPGVCHFQPCDVSQPDQIERLIDQTVEQFGQLDCLINNAGYHPRHKPIDEFSVDDLLHVFQTNMVSCFAACKYALPHLRKVRGSIINMSSLVAQMGQTTATTYCATKGAMNAFTKSLAIEEARHGVRVNVVLPGGIITEGAIDYFAASEKGKEIERWANSLQPMGRVGTSEEVGQVCLFLASEAASYLTGVEIIISGGAEIGYGVKYPMKELH